MLIKRLINIVFRNFHFLNTMKTSFTYHLNYNIIIFLFYFVPNFNNIHLFYFQTYIPHFIGELNKLKSFYVNSNMLEFLPGCFQTRLFNNLNICDNNYKDTIQIPTNPHIFIDEVRNPNFKALRDLSFDSIIKNCVQLSSQYIPIGLQHFFHSFSRCRICHSIVYSHNTNETFEYDWIKTLNITSHNSPMAWQYFECYFKCNSKC